MALSSGIDVRMLGPLEVYRAGERLDVGSRRQRLVLGLLLFKPQQTVSIARLTSLVWLGRTPPRSARNAIQIAVSGLRASLAPHISIVTDDDGYRLDLADHSTDVSRFRKLLADARDLDGEARAQLLRSADALWRGPVLLGTLDEAQRQLLATGLEEERAAALEARFDVELRLGRHSDIVGEIADAHAAQPLRERLVEQLMLALYRDGQVHRSLEVYRESRKLFATDLGMDPAQTLRDLEVSIIRRSRDLDVTVTHVNGPLAARRPAER